VNGDANRSRELDRIAGLVAIHLRGRVADRAGGFGVVVDPDPLIIGPDDDGRFAGAVRLLLRTVPEERIGRLQHEERYAVPASRWKR